MLNFKLDIGKVLVGVLTAGIITGSGFAIGGIFDFQNMKKTVSSHDRQLKVVSQIICMYAVRDKLENADRICNDVLTK